MAPEPPPVIWFNGAIRPWAEATVHVWTELATRGANVFEGIRAYQHPDGHHRVLSGAAHLRRLFESAALLRMPTAYSQEALVAAIDDLLVAFAGQGHLYLRPTLYVEHGRNGVDLSDTVTGAYVAALPVRRPDKVSDGIRVCVSTWRRGGDLVFSPLIKAGSAYHAFRLPLLEARDMGADEAILLNEQGRVTEATGANLFMVRGEQVITPPLSAGILAGITRSNLIEVLEQDLGLEVIERDIPRTELYLADEVFLCGTLAEVVPVVAIDGRSVGTCLAGPVTAAARNRYLGICDGLIPDTYGWFGVPARSPTHRVAEAPTIDNAR